ncbi:MAG: TetR/AcrR family transcriptional regulator C-terminal domain-containing protein [Clostridia bacterium]|nr:TetR/AcrR family transcriptional regulator C-terminal domain-containing protein [Clostridia bacterium]
MEKRRYFASDHAKNELAATLKELLKTRTPERISVKDLTSTCGMGRQNFYYHFNDLNDLLYWTLRRDAASALRGENREAASADGLLRLCRYFEANRAFCSTAIETIGSVHLSAFWDDDVRSFIRELIERRTEQLGLHLDEIEMAACSRFYTAALWTQVRDILYRTDRMPSPQALGQMTKLLDDQLIGLKQRTEHIPAVAG